MYRGAIYLPYEKCVRLNTWNDDGVRVSYDFPYNPYLYVETTIPQCDAMSIFNTRLRKLSFNTQGSRSKYVKENIGVRLFENLPPVQQFLIDKFYTQNDSPAFTQFPLKVWFIDIEAVSEKEFPSADKAAYPINVITIYDVLTEQYYIWGLKPFEVKQKNWTFFHFPNEKDLLESFIQFFEKDPCDILSGYNIDGFDIPYIINRITNLLGGVYAQRLSPTKRLTNRVFHNRFGKEQVKWTIDGIACIDYLEIYKKFCMQMRESYKLDYVAELEIGENKIDYGEQNLFSLMENNWQLFVEYNIQDVALLDKLEKKLKYLELVRMIAYAGCVPFETALGTLSVVNGLCAIRAHTENKKIHTFDRSDTEEGKIEGAHVSEPQSGFQEYIVSFDANSLYPNTMITLNLSPETKVGKIIFEDKDNVEVQHVNNQSFKLTRANFDAFVKQEKISVSKASILFSQKKKGIIPSIIDSYYKLRVQLKVELKKAKKQLASIPDEDKEAKKKKQAEVDYLNIKQHTVKILLNSIYGYFANKRAPLGDEDIARSITLTGQSVIKQASLILTNFEKQHAPTVTTDSNIYGDTDSKYFTLKHLVKAKGISLLDENGKITKEYYSLVQEIEDHLNTEIKTWGEKELNSHDCRLLFKRECIADKGMFLMKKRYVLHILDDEGIPCNKFKYTGVDVVRTTMPKAIKPYAKKLIETMILTQDKSAVDKLFHETYELFKTLPLEDIANVKGISDYDKYANKCSEFTFVNRIPQHVKAAYCYNLLLKQMGIEQKYEKLGSGDKLRYFYTQKPNKYGLSVIGYKYKFPEEFKHIFKPDYELMFEKVLFSVLERFYVCANWQMKDPSMVAQTDLFQLLS